VRPRGAATLAALLIAAGPAAGCGRVEEPRPAPEQVRGMEPTGTAVIAVDRRIRTVDPLHATNRAELLTARQVYEPLVARQSAPFGERRVRTGLARSLSASADETVWSARLRRGVRFEDGTPFDADAVLDNVARWQESRRAADLLPGLVAADSPRPGLVRFVFERPISGLRSRLGSARLGLVSPAAITRGSRPIAADASGTGPFELRERERHRVLLVRNAGWWGRVASLGPGVERIELRTIGGERRRYNDLVDGAAVIAFGLGAGALRAIQEDPLFDGARHRGTGIAFERSVRGVDAIDHGSSLAGLWLTDLR
jgi:peptide/nickel transport system substrate-binding protein